MGSINPGPRISRSPVQKAKGMEPSSSGVGSPDFGEHKQETLSEVRAQVTEKTFTVGAGAHTDHTPLPCQVPSVKRQ